MRCPIVLLFVTKQAKVLFNFLVLVLYFAIILRMVGSSKTGLDTKALIESSHEMGSKLWAVIREDLLRDSMKTEYVRIMDVSGTLGCKVRLAGYEVALI
jgi:membrane protein required for beta-lactamase induction